MLWNRFPPFCFFSFCGDIWSTKIEINLETSNIPSAVPSKTGRSHFHHLIHFPMEPDEVPLAKWRLDRDCQDAKRQIWFLKKQTVAIHDSWFIMFFVLCPDSFFCWWIFIGYSEQEEMLVEKLGWNPEASSGGPSMFRWQLVLVDVESLVNRNCSTRSLSVKGKLWKTPKEFCKVCWKPSEVKWFSFIILVCFDDFGISDCGVEGGITHLRTIHHV